MLAIALGIQRHLPVKFTLTSYRKFLTGSISKVAFQVRQQRYATPRRYPFQEVKGKMPKFEREIEIDATVEKVWQVMTDPAKWPQWFPGVDAITMAPPVSEGAVFEWTTEGKVGRSAIVKMLPLKRLEIMTQVDDDKDMHVFELRPSGGFFGLNADECKVEYTLDTLMGGGILGNFVAGGNPKDALRVKKAVHLLRRLVESL
jgi:uncharacterized protein YndB with AHSA1/START domain